MYIPRPHDGGLLDVLGPDPGAPVSHGEEVLGEAGVALERVDGAVVGVVDGRDLLVHRLRLLVAGEHAAWGRNRLIDENHEIVSERMCPIAFRTCEVKLDGGLKGKHMHPSLKATFFNFACLFQCLSDWSRGGVRV